ncbi:MAG: alpha-amylase [Desulfobacteraceae bacterium]|nr:MAG: alpha-amylase [Desulfobacteraceae bacterium]
MNPTFFPSNNTHRAAWAAVLLALWLLGCAHLPTGLAPPDTVKPGAVMYGVVPPLFGHKPLQDVTARLDYLQELGVDIILLSPINATDDPSSISYSITDYFNLRPDFGNVEDLKQLVGEAERRGIKVMMDFVPNHTSTAHPFYQDVQKNGKASVHYDFYDRDNAGQITHYFDWVGLPNLNYDHPEVISMMTRAFKYWIHVAGIDGYRADAAWGIRQRAPQVWHPLIRELRAIDPGVIMVAEAGARDPFYIRNGFDLAYDWTEELGHWAWKPVFERVHRAGSLIHEALTKNQYAPRAVLRFLNNNDTGLRFITRYGLDVTRVAAVLQHTVPGVPLVYTGDEIGAEYEPYEDPPPIAWEDKHNLRQLYRRLAGLREALPAIHSGDFIPLPPRGGSSAYAFIRIADRHNWALVLLNFDLFPEMVTLYPPKDIVELISGSALKDALSGTRMRLSADGAGELKMHLDAYTAMILIPEQ